ncbi:MAG: hypothetical protein OES26_21105, partial [Gammaproteobacteria bacterium]|nr:hypothetical protein [Gammaproteobacteria bacterium]
PMCSIQGAIRREWRALSKNCNDVVDPLGGSRRACQQAPIRVVAPRRHSYGYSSSARLAPGRLLAR